uniref:DNA primase n=1 Tax=Angiostrongylus cantonensis TaxID=6313 RepID=A0A0K0DI01_ANGCA
LEDVIKKRIADTEKEIAKWSSLARKLEEQDCLGTDPFIDYIAYRFHPLNTRGELRRWFGMHEEQFKTNSGVLSVMPGALWYLRETKHIFIARYERDLDRLSAQLDEYCGRQQAQLTLLNHYDLYGKPKLIVEEDEYDPDLHDDQSEDLPSANEGDP